MPRWNPYFGYNKVLSHQVCLYPPLSACPLIVASRSARINPSIARLINTQSLIHLYQQYSLIIFKIQLLIIKRPAH